MESDNSFVLPERAKIVLINTGKAEALRELRKLAPDAEVHVITEDSYAHLYGSTETLHLVQDVADVSSVLRKALKIAEDGPIDFLVSPSERSMLAGGFLRSYFSLPGQPFDTANLFSNKAAMKTKLRSEGVAVAPYRAVVGAKQVARAAECLGFPLVIKPAFGTGSMNTFVLRSQAELVELLGSDIGQVLFTKPRLLLVEQYLDVDNEYSCDGIVSNSKVVFALPSRYSTPVLGHVGDMLGTVTLDPDSETGIAILRMHAQAVAALGMTNGVTHLEILDTSDGWVLGEIACRPGGAGVVRNGLLSRGVDLWEAFMRHSLGDDPGLSAAADHGYRGANMWTELPTRPGKIAAISNEEDFALIDGLLDVDMHVRVGEEISPRMHSSSTTGLVFLQIASNAKPEVEEKLAEIRLRYVLVMEGESEGEQAFELATSLDGAVHNV